MKISPRCFRLWSAFLVLGLTLLLAACGPGLTRDRFDQVKSGMTEAEVRAILGEPQKSESGSFLGISGTAYSYLEGSTKAEIVFVNGKVMTTNWSAGEKPPEK
jgi:hypothetical protein